MASTDEQPGDDAPRPAIEPAPAELPRSSSADAPDDVHDAPVDDGHVDDSASNSGWVGGDPLLRPAQRPANADPADGRADTTAHHQPDAPAANAAGAVFDDGGRTDDRDARAESPEPAAPAALPPVPERGPAAPPPAATIAPPAHAAPVPPPASPGPSASPWAPAAAQPTGPHATQSPPGGGGPGQQPPITAAAPAVPPTAQQPAASPPRRPAPSRRGAAAAKASRSPRVTTQSSPGRRARVRRVTRVVRHVDPWSVFKISAVFCFIAYGIALLSGWLLWRVAYATGTIDNIESGLMSTGWSTFELHGEEIFRNAWVGGLFVTVGMIGLAVLTATLFNLVTDLVGGIRLTVLEEEVIEKTAKPTKTAKATTSAKPATSARPAKSGSPAPARRRRS